MALLDDDGKVAARKERETPMTERLLRQFLSTDGPKGNSSTFKRNWARNFGRKTGEHSGAPKCVDAECECGGEKNKCDDEFCWCKRSEE